MSGARPDSPQWTAARRVGDPTEDAAARWFARTGGEVLRYVGPAKADLEVRWRIECKRDAKAGTTGNVAVETEYRGRPSGIADTHATHWLYDLGAELVLIRTPELRAMINAGRYPRVSAGDGKRAVVVLVPVADLKRAGRVIRAEDVA